VGSLGPAGRLKFLSATARIVEALLEAGFTPTRAQQAGVRKGGSPLHARHMIRFSFLKEALSLLDAIPEIILVNSHDGSSAYLMLVFACHHRRDSTCYPPNLQLNTRRSAMVTFSDELTVRNEEAGAPDRLIQRHRSRRQGALLLTRCARCGASRGHRAYAPDARAGQCLVSTHIRPSSATVLGVRNASIRTADPRWAHGHL
jgi:hypothetical protein